MILLISGMACYTMAVLCFFMFKPMSFECVICFGVFVCAGLLNGLSYLVEKIYDSVKKNKS